jgi:hypothetical protein
MDPATRFAPACRHMAVMPQDRRDSAAGDE